MFRLLFTAIIGRIITPPLTIADMERWRHIPIMIQKRPGTIMCPIFSE
jgi:hypothetical protein